MRFDDSVPPEPLLQGASEPLWSCQQKPDESFPKCPSKDTNEPTLWGGKPSPLVKSDGEVYQGHGPSTAGFPR